MSFLALGYKAKKIAGLIAAGKLTDVESVIAKAKDMQLAETYGLTQDAEKLDQWYTKLAENLFYKKEFIFPDFADIGFGEEFVEKTADPLPTKKATEISYYQKEFSPLARCSCCVQLHKRRSSCSAESLLSRL